MRRNYAFGGGGIKIMKAYILTLCAAAIAVTVTNCLLPEGSVKKYAKLTSSVMISLAIALPFAKLLNGDFTFNLPETEEYSIDYDAQSRYKDILKKEYKSTIETGLSDIGRAYAEVDDDLNVKKIEIYAINPIDGEDEARINEYNPEKVEVYYEQNN